MKTTRLALLYVYNRVTRDVAVAEMIAYLHTDTFIVAFAARSCQIQPQSSH